MFMRIRKLGNRKLLALFLFVMLALPVALTGCSIPSISLLTAQEGTCIDDVTGRTNNCTANDVRLGTFYNIEDIECVSGEMVEVFLQADLVAGSSERYDIGMFVAEDGGDARTGACYRDFLNPIATAGTCEDGSTPCNKDSDCFGKDECIKAYDPLTGFGPFLDAETDDNLDVCGDLEQGVHNFYDLAPDAGITVPCIDSNGDGTLDISACTSWDSQKTATCLDVDDAIPSTKAKCRCESIEVGNVFVLPGEIRVSKLAVPDSVPEPGDDVVFTFGVENTSVVVITINTLVDTIYGDLTAYSGSTCTTPQVLKPAGQPGSTYTCSISAFVGGEPHTQTNTVTAEGIDENDNPVTGSATEQVLVTDAPPAIDVDKAVAPGTVPEPGGTVLYTVSVRNDSGASDPLTLMSLIDDIYGDLTDAGNPDISNSTCELVTIAPGETYQCTFEAEVTGNAGDIVADTVTGTGEDDETNSVSDSDSAEVVITDVTPAIDVVKEVNPGSVPEPGGTVLYTVSVTNESGAEDPLTLTSLIDDIYGDLTDAGNPDISNSTCELVTIDPANTYQCTFEAEATGNAGDSVVDTVTGAGEDDEGNSVSDLDSAEVVFTDVTPAIDVVKGVNPSSVAEPGGMVLYTVSVANESGAEDPLTLTSLVDDIHGDLTDPGNPDISNSTCELVIVDPGVIYQCTFEAEVLGNAGDTVVDTVTGTGADDEGNSVDDSDTAEVTITDVAPAIDVVKDVNPSSVAEPGGTVLYTVSVTNNSGASDPLTLTSLMDDVYGDLTDDGNPDIFNSTCELVTIQPDDTYSCTFEAQVSGNAGDSVPDMVTGIGQDDEGNSVSDWDTANVIITDAAPAINVVKDVDPSTVLEPGGIVLYIVSVTNSSSARDPLTLSSLTDDIYGDLTDDANPDIFNSTCELVTIGPGETYPCEFEAEVLGSAGDRVIDTVTAIGQDDEGNSVSDTDTAQVDIVDVLPAIDVAKSVVPSSVLEPGGMVLYTVRVTNNSSGGDTLTLTSLVDDVYGDLTDAGNPDIFDSTCELVAILPGATYQCTFGAEVTGNAGDREVDTVTGSGVDDEGNSVSDSDTAEVEITDVPPAIDVVKSVNPDSVAEPGGTVLYTVNVKNSGNVYDPLTLTSLVDDIYGDLTDDGNPDIYNSTCELVTLQPGATYQCTFNAEVSGNAGDTVVDSVTAVGQDDEGNSVSDSDTAEVEITDILPAIDVIKLTGISSVVEPGGEVQYAVGVHNISNEYDPVTLTSLVDDIYGDLTDDSNPDIWNSTCGLVDILPGATYNCTFNAEVTGVAGDSVTDTVTAIAEDDEGNEVQDADEATVLVVWEPPDTGVDLPAPFVAGGLGLLGLVVVGASVVVRRRSH